MTVKKKPTTPSKTVDQFQEDLYSFFCFATEMRAKGALKVMVSRGEGVDYVVEFEGKEEETEKHPRHSMGFTMSEECEED